jgi:hypothetical protein
VKTGFISIKAVELLWKFGALVLAKWKLYLWYHYIKKARSCEQALEIVCGKVALGRVLRYNKKVGLRIVVFLFRTR